MSTETKYGLKIALLGFAFLVAVVLAAYATSRLVDLEEERVTCKQLDLLIQNHETYLKFKQDQDEQP